MLCPTYPPNDVPCGVGDYTRELATRLAGAGVSLTVVASQGHCPSPNPESGIRTIALAKTWDRRAIGALFRIIREQRFDIIHVQYTPELYGRGSCLKLLPLALTLRGGPPVVLAPHTLIGGYPLATALAPFLVGFCRRIISTNEEVSYLISKYLTPFRGRTREIPIGSNIPAFLIDKTQARFALRTELGLAAGEILLAHFGFVYPGKGLETLFAALGILRAAGVQLKLAVVGDVWPGSEDYSGKLRRLSRELGISDYVVWLGRCQPDRVGAVLSASDIYVVPYDEGISTRRGTLMAGIAYGLPIISTHSTLPSRWLRHNENVLLVPRKDPQALAEAIQALIASPSLCDQLHRGVMKLADTFSWSTIARATIAVYREICPQ